MKQKDFNQILLSLALLIIILSSITWIVQRVRIRVNWGFFTFNKEECIEKIRERAQEQQDYPYGEPGKVTRPAPWFGGIDCELKPEECCNRPQFIDISLLRY